MSKSKIVVLLSGGLDSATCLALAVKNVGAENVAALSVFYGQKHDKELECARKLSQFYNVSHYTMDLSPVFEGCQCALLKQSDSDVPESDYATQLETAEYAPTYVPFRNGLMLSAAAAKAMSIFPDSKVSLAIGAHADDAAGNAYPDCSKTFVEAMNEAIHLGTSKYVSLFAPFVECSKSDIVQKGLELKVPYELTWSCYNGRDKACGKCGTCLDRLAAFAANNAVDPIKYEEG